MSRSPLLLLLVMCFSLPLFVGCGGCDGGWSGRRALPVRKRQPEPEPAPAVAPTPAPAPTTTAPATAQAASPATTTKSPPVNAPATTPTAPSTVAPSPARPALSVPALPAPGSVAIERIPNDDRWSHEKKVEQAAQRMRKISLAIMQYARQEKRLPGNIARSGQPLLSWRVALLPYLGDEELAGKFNLSEPWDSPTNLAAAAFLPDVYRSPWGGEQTPFLAVCAPGGLFTESGEDTTASLSGNWWQQALLVMGDETRQTEWTRPTDFNLEAENPAGSLGQSQGGFLVAFGDGEARWIAADAPAEKLKALFLGGASLAEARATLAQPITAAAGSKRSVAANAGMPDVEIPGPGSASTAVGSTGPRPPVSTAPMKADDRAAVPNSDDIEKAKARLRQIFVEEIAKSKKADSRRTKHALATALMENEAKVAADPAAHYVLLQTAQDSAAAAGDFELAMQAADLLVKHYQVDPVIVRHKAMAEAARFLLPHFADQNDALYTASESLAKEALRQDNFVAAKEIGEVMLACARRTGDRNKITKATSAAKEVEDVKKAWQGVPASLAKLSQTPDDPEANLSLGLYYSLIQFRWREGLPLLVKGSSLRYRVLASEDLSRPTDPNKMAELANEYWALSETEASLKKRGLQLRAVYWYQTAQPTLPNNFHRVQGERRIEEAKKSYGESLVTEALSLMGDPKPVAVAD